MKSKSILHFFLILFVFIISSCSVPVSEQIDLRNLRSAAKKTDSPEAVTSPETGQRTYTDSAHFSIIRGNYPSGEKYIEVYENKLTKLDDWKEYYENGQLKMKGVMTNASHVYVGMWHYYSDLGKTDSIIDHDKKYRISYFDALKIAGKEGFKMPEMDVALTSNEKNTFWKISGKPKVIGENKVLSINTQTGRITKFDNQFTTID